MYRLFKMATNKSPFILSCAITMGLIMTALIPNKAMSFFSSSDTQIELSFSGSRIVFRVPQNFSKDYPPPNALSKSFNIYDPDIYEDASNALFLYDMFWDYQSGLIFKSIDGTLSMNVSLYKTTAINVNIDGPEQLIKIIPRDFEAIYGNKDTDDYDISGPHDLSVRKIKSLSWASYHYKINDALTTAYAIPISKQHYLRVIFRLIDSHKSNNFKAQAKVDVQQIMASFSKE